MANPEFNIITRTKQEIVSLAAEGAFIAAADESVRPVNPSSVVVWTVPEGDDMRRTNAGLQNFPFPAITISPVRITTQPGRGLNCAEDEAIRVAVQILDNQPVSRGRYFASYGNWISAIRSALLVTPNPFLQDANVNEYDPFVVHPIERIPAEARSLLNHNQRVSYFLFQVMVRHHR